MFGEILIVIMIVALLGLRWLASWAEVKQAENLLKQIKTHFND